MCGVFTTTTPEAWEDKIDEVLHLLSHRGPDHSSREVIDGAVLMGHTRLEVIGLGTVGQQPAKAPDGSVVLVFNGEIYNYQHLKSGLNVDRRTSDTQVLTAIVSERRLESLSRLRGMYAFVAWDRRDGSLLAMRDPFGIKPLYILRHRMGGITLSSEIAPLLLCPEAREVDRIGLGQYLSMGHTTNSHTLFARIRKLDPGSLYTWRRDSTGAFNLQIERPEQRSCSQATLEQALEDSVKAHLTADVEVGAFLSSGVDSTLLCAIARKHVDGLRTYTLTFPEAPFADEGQLAGANARVMGLHHVKVEVRSRDMAAMAEEVVKAHGEPLGDAAVLPLSVLARRASQDLKVVLTGEGADEIFGGYGRYRISRRLGGFTRAVAPLGAQVARHWSRARDDKPRSRAFEALLWGGGVRSHAALLSSDLSLLDQACPETYRDVLTAMKADWQRLDDSGSELGRSIEYDRICWLPNTYLEKTDRATMLFGLEARVPYLDPVVVATAAAGSMEMHAKEEPRQLLRSIVPDVELPSRKVGLAVDIPSLLELPELSEPFKFELLDSNSVLGQLIPDEKKSMAVERCRQSPTFAFRVAMLGIWEGVNSSCATI
jgi:asparagine synthase (glutamine-hydrolysing)